MSERRKTKAQLSDKLSGLQKQSTASGELGSEHAKMIEALRWSEKWFRNIFEKSPISIHLYDSRGRFLDANQACLDMFGVSRAQLVMKQPSPLTDRRLSAETRQQLCDGNTVRYEGYFDFQKGKLIVIRASAAFERLQPWANKIPPVL
jgi:PAS domain S-box-containing protein